jgi:hypothetical protein
MLSCVHAIRHLVSDVGPVDGHGWSPARERAGGLRRDGERVWFVWRIVWTLATLMAGLLTVSIYWVMHHSTLARRPAPDSTFS